MNERKAKLKEIMKELNKKNPGLVKYGSEEPVKEKLSWGVKEIDELSGGIRRGNFSIIYGGKSVGKSTLVQQMIAENQKKGLTCCYIDMERTFDTDRAVAMGVNLEDLVLVTSAQTAEEAMDIIIKMSRNNLIDIYVVDSVQAMSPEAEQFTKTRADGSGGKERSTSDDSMALLARKLSQFFRMCSGALHKSNAACVLVGQVRTAGLGGFYIHDDLTGGHALKHWAVSILAMRTGQGADAPTKKEIIEEEDPDGGITKKKKEIKIGHDCVFKVEKTKVTGSKPEGSEIHIPFYFESGFYAPVEKALENLSPSVQATTIVPEEPKKKRGRKKEK